MIYHKNFFLQYRRHINLLLFLIMNENNSKFFFYFNSIIFRKYYRRIISFINMNNQIEIVISYVSNFHKIVSQIYNSNFRNHLHYVKKLKFFSTFETFDQISKFDYFFDL